MVDAETTPYTRIARSDKFRALIAHKKAFLIPTCLFFFVFYFTLPILTSYFTVLNTPAYGAITWAWVFGFAQFIMTWTLCSVYTRKAAQFDRDVAAILEETER